MMHPKSARPAAPAASDTDRDARFRAQIQQIGSHLTLPVARRALGLIEGEHGSLQRGTGFDFLDLRDYQPGDSARSIDWTASARLGKPIVINRQREVTSTIWLLLDTGDEMNGTAESGEKMIDVAANALRMFALLSLRRSDEISLVLADAGAISRTPFLGGYAKFDRTLQSAVEGINPAPRNLTALFRYAQKIPAQDSLVVIATSANAVTADQMPLVTSLSEDHSLVFITVEPVNPFSPSQPRVGDAQSGKMMPAFLRTHQLAEETKRRRAALRDAFRHELRRHDDLLLSGGSSFQMLDRFIALLSLGTRTNTARSANFVANLQGAAR
jgi:uncharacterized protein (DUF58 family)